MFRARSSDLRYLHAGAWIVDTEARKVSCVGSAKFTWTEGAGKGNWWEEKFVYHLDFDDEGKVTDYQVWSDSGAAYLAWNGKLNSLREVWINLSLDWLLDLNRPRYRNLGRMLEK